MRIGVDIDDVLYPTMKTLALWHNRIYGTDLTLYDFKSYFLSRLWNISRDKVNARMKMFVESEEFLTMKHDIWAVLALSEYARSDNLFVVTSRRPWTKSHTIKVLNKDFPNIFDDIFFTDHCADNGGYKRTKSNVCKDYNLDILIEDCLEYSIECASIVDRVYLLDKPWNRSSSKLSKKIKRIRGGWKGLYKSLYSYREKKKK